jgi:hypothetical protein
VEELGPIQVTITPLASTEERAVKSKPPEASEGILMKVSGDISMRKTSKARSEKRISFASIPNPRQRKESSLSEKEKGDGGCDGKFNSILTVPSLTTLFA